MIEFVFNATTLIFIELFVFMTIYEFESRMSFDSVSNDESAKKRILRRKASNIIERWKASENSSKKS
jgi:hypothetical protein